MLWHATGSCMDLPVPAQLLHPRHACMRACERAVCLPHPSPCRTSSVPPRLLPCRGRAAAGAQPPGPRNPRLLQPQARPRHRAAECVGHPGGAAGRGWVGGWAGGSKGWALRQGYAPVVSLEAWRRPAPTTPAFPYPGPFLPVATPRRAAAEAEGEAAEPVRAEAQSQILVGHLASYEVCGGPA